MRILIFTAGLSAAASLANAAALSDVLISGPGPGCKASDRTGALVTASCTATADRVTTTGSATAVAAGGHLGTAVFVDTQAHSADGPGGYTALTYAQTVDRLRIDASNGEQGQALLTFAVSLAVQRTSITNAPGPSAVTFAGTGSDLRADVTIAGENHSLWLTETYRVDYRPETGPIGDGSSVAYIDDVAVPSALGPRTFAVPFTFGQEFDLQLELRGYVFAGAAGDGHATMNIEAMNSFDWKGIQSVTVGGRDVAFSLTSESGVDWISPVPEPTSAWLLASGLAACAALVCMRQRRDKL
ncbi:hypothetical protein MW290_22200 [Aquincola tertiaricarbonis]|uniref:PEP-CTERM protein-sorting domain-containing protein n=1 Tax=Aquincola tertiaricarbonis TaxID=391953 RepID=A0ABY4SJW0_AQUTE|nr:hypothetical protein MW290_22200 [Aquincola tertiaricarbonis]